MDPGQVLRAARRRRGLNQRELARAAGLPHSTVARIESGEIRPRLATMLALLRGVGMTFVVVDHDGTPLAPDEWQEGLRDGLGRRLPAHLVAWEVRMEGDAWWGWNRIAWSMKDPRVPRYTYLGRSWSEPWPHRWDDAT